MYGAVIAAPASASPANVRMLVALAIVIAVARAGGALMARLGAPPVMGEIVAGIVLGPSLLGLLWPDAYGYIFPPSVIAALNLLSTLGLVLFMFLVGVELDTSRLVGLGRATFVISQTAFAVPFGFGMALAAWLFSRVGSGDGDRVPFVLFVGAAMAVTAFPVLVRILDGRGLTRSRIGIVAITCAAIADVTTWCVVAVVSALVHADGPSGVLLRVTAAAVFACALIGVVRPLLARLSTVPLWLAVTVALTSAWCTEQFGVHAIFGAFLAGIAMPRDPGLGSLIHDRIGVATSTILLPVVFTVAGLATHVDLINSPARVATTAVIIVVAVVGKLASTALAARFTGETWRDATTLGILLNTRGLTELVILNIGLTLGVINHTLFTMMVLMALVTTLAATPLLNLVERIPIRGERVRGTSGIEPTVAVA